MMKDKCVESRIQKDLRKFNRPLEDDEPAVKPVKDSHKIGAFRKFINNIIDGFRSAKNFIREHITNLFAPDVNPVRHIYSQDPKNLPSNNGIFELYVQPLNKSDPDLSIGSSPSLQPTPTQYFETPEAPIKPPLEKSVEHSIGENSFQQFFKLFKEKNGAIEFTPGYVSFTPECLAYARQLAESAVGKNVSKMSNAEEINAAKALIEGDHSHRIAQEQTAAGEVLKQEKIKKQELEKTKLPGQSDFEDFFTMYLKHKNADTKLVIYEGSKFMTDECINYAKSILGPPEPTNSESSEKVLAERFLSTWRANPAASLAQANSSEKFQMPPALPPPVARVRTGTAQVPTSLPSWETAALGLQSLSDAEIEMLASITSTSLEKLNQVLKGLRLVSIASTKKNATIVEGGTGQRAGFRSRWPDSSPTAIDDLQEAQYWLKKTKVLILKNCLRLILSSRLFCNLASVSVKSLKSS